MPRTRRPSTNALTSSASFYLLKNGFPISPPFSSIDTPPCVEFQWWTYLTSCPSAKRISSPPFSLSPFRVSELKARNREISICLACVATMNELERSSRPWIDEDPETENREVSRIRSRCQGKDLSPRKSLRSLSLILRCDYILVRYLGNESIERSTRTPSRLWRNLVSFDIPDVADFHFLFLSKELQFYHGKSIKFENKFFKYPRKTVHLICGFFKTFLLKRTIFTRLFCLKNRYVRGKLHSYGL